LDFKRFETESANNVVYAREDGIQNRINFYIPNFDTVADEFINRKQGYSGYRVFYRATTAEQNFITTILEFIMTIDSSPGDKFYEILPVYYMEITEIILQLKAAGYTAIDTSKADEVNDKVISAVKEGASPVIYSAPRITSGSTSISTQFSGRSEGRIGGNQFNILDYKNPTATSDIHNLMVYGSREEIDSVRNFVEMLDIPAKQILIEAQIIEINIDDLSDIGLRQSGGHDDLLQGSTKAAFPGESGSTSQEDTAIIFTYDDSGASAGDFQASIAALILEGNATIKARPKITPVDGRQAIITIVRQVPVVQETIINQNQSRFDISFVPVGITLNIKPRIGRGNSEISMQVNAVVSNVETINNVVTGLNIQAPELNTREVSTTVRIPNHQPLILGGLISTQTEERTYKVPLLGDIPLIGKLFRRSKSKQDRTEILIVITPHVANEVGDRIVEEPNEYNIDSALLTPNGSSYLDELDNFVTPATYFIKFDDIVGFDPMSRKPTSFEGEAPEIGSVNDPVLLTIKRIIRKLKLVDKLDMSDEVVFPNWFERKNEKTDKKLIAEAYLINYTISINNLTFENLLVGRVIMLPSRAMPPEGPETGRLKWSKIKMNSETDSNTTLKRIVESLISLDSDTISIEETEEE
ncbi:hypothetical protein KKB99_03960, partial [bacterium]|nr:hypothetical protein [bacterium]MBU1025148.1 hypothetical protein [bacterium]